MGRRPAVGVHFGTKVADTELGEQANGQDWEIISQESGLLPGDVPKEKPWGLERTRTSQEVPWRAGYLCSKEAVVWLLQKTQAQQKLPKEQ